MDYQPHVNEKLLEWKKEAEKRYDECFEKATELQKELDLLRAKSDVMSRIIRRNQIEPEFWNGFLERHGLKELEKTINTKTKEYQETLRMKNLLFADFELIEKEVKILVPQNN